MSNNFKVQNLYAKTLNVTGLIFTGLVYTTGNQAISGIKIFGENTNIYSSTYSHILGGQLNTISGATHATIAGGSGNNIFKNYGSILGGQNNMVSGNHSFIGAGRFNSGYGNYSVIVGGSGNLIKSTANFASIIGGRNVLVDSGHSGAAVFADGENRSHISKGPHTCSLDFINGVYLKLPLFTGTNSETGSLGELRISGDYLYLATGQNAWGRIQISTFT